MRKAVLTEIERKTIEEYLKRGKNGNAVRVLRYRAKRFLPQITEDMKLLEKFLHAPS